MSIQDHGVAVPQFQTHFPVTADEVLTVPMVLRGDIGGWPVIRKANIQHIGTVKEFSVDTFRKEPVPHFYFIRRYLNIFSPA